MKHLSVIIVTYKSERLIFDCLDSIFKYNDIGDSLEVIIVDNASPNQKETFHFIKEKYGERIVLIDSGNNGGYGKGNNIGIRQATAEYVIVMNPDIRLVSPIFSSIYQVLCDNQVGMLGVNFIDGSNPFYFKPEHMTVVKEFLLKWYIKRKKYDSSQMYMSGSFLAFNRQTFINAGSFDETIFLYLEEPDITNRIQRTGKDVYWCPDMYVLHLPHPSVFNDFVYKNQIVSLKYYSEKYNFDLSANLKTRIRYLQIKFVGAFLLKNGKKRDFFKSLILFYKQEYKESKTKQI